MNKATTVDFKELVLTHLKVTLHPHMGGVREDGAVKLSWRERWETSKTPSMFYSLTGSAVINGRTRRVDTVIPAVRNGVLRKLGVERPTVDEEGNPILDENGMPIVDKMISEYPAPQSLKCHVDNGELVFDEALPVSADGAECPPEFGLSFLIFTAGHKAIVLKDVLITKDDVAEKGAEYMDVHALSGYDVIDVGSATGAPVTAGYALPKGPITRKAAARDTRVSAPATVDDVAAPAPAPAIRKAAAPATVNVVR